MGNRKYARLPLGLNLYWREGGALQHLSGGVLYTVDSSSMFISVHVGATTGADSCAKEGKTALL